MHRCDQRVLEDVVWIGAFPLTSVPRTLLDLSGRRHPNAEAGLDQALRKDLTQLPEMWAIYDREWMRGRRGVAILRTFLVERSRGLAIDDSELEAMMLRLINGWGLRSPIPQYPVDLPDGTIHVDFAWPDLRVAVECDSYSWHMDRRAFEEDRRRDVELQALDWVILRFTWVQIRWQPDYVVSQLQTHLQGRAQKVADASSA